MASTEADFESIMQVLSYGSTYHVTSGFYVFMYKMGSDNDGDCVAHGANQAFVGLNLQGILDLVGNTFVDGNALHTAFSDAAFDGGGWVDYYWANNVGDTLFMKIALIAGVEMFGTSYYLGVGFNHAMRDYAYAPGCATCATSYSYPCSITNTFNLISHGQAESLRDLGKAELFSNITHSDEFKLDTGFYIFIYDFDGPCVAHGARDDFVGLTLQGILDYVGNTAVNGTWLHEHFVKNANLGGGWTP